MTITNAHGTFEPEWSCNTGEAVAFYRPQMTRACVVLPLAKDWPSTLGTFKRNLKESLRRSRNRVVKDGREFTVVARTDDLDAHRVNQFLALHRHRSASTSTVVHTAAYANPRYQAFLRDVLPELGRRGRAQLLELHLEGRPVAVQLALFAPGVTYFHSFGLDLDFWAMGLVTFLQERLVKEAIERGDRWVNFSPGPNVAKLRWSEQIDLHLDFAYGSGPEPCRLEVRRVRDRSDREPAQALDRDVAQERGPRAGCGVPDPASERLIPSAYRASGSSGGRGSMRRGRRNLDLLPSDRRPPPPPTSPDRFPQDRSPGVPPGSVGVPREPLIIGSFGIDLERWSLGCS